MSNEVIGTDEAEPRDFLAEFKDAITRRETAAYAQIFAVYFQLQSDKVVTLEALSEVGEYVLTLADELDIGAMLWHTLVLCGDAFLAQDQAALDDLASYPDPDVAWVAGLDTPNSQAARVQRTMIEFGINVAVHLDPSLAQIADGTVLSLGAPE